MEKGKFQQKKKKKSDIKWQMDLRKQLKFPEHYLSTTTNFLNKEKNKNEKHILDN